MQESEHSCGPSEWLATAFSSPHANSLRQCCTCEKNLQSGVLECFALNKCLNSALKVFRDYDDFPVRSFPFAGVRPEEREIYLPADWQFICRQVRVVQP